MRTNVSIESTKGGRVRTPPRHPDAAWWIEAGASALGERGIAEALIEQLKRGVANCPSGVPCTDPCSDAQLGWGPKWAGEGLVERARHGGRIWSRLSRATQAVLVARYESRQWPAGVRAALGGLAGVVILQQAGRYAEIRTEAAKERHQKATAKAEELRQRLGEVTPSRLAAARARVRAAAHRALEREELWPSVNRASNAVDLLTEESPLGYDLVDLESELVHALLEVADAQVHAQEIILDRDMFPVFDACQKATRKDQEGRAARARVESWKGPAAEAVLEAHDAWDLAHRFITVFEQRQGARS